MTTFGNASQNRVVSRRKDSTKLSRRSAESEKNNDADRRKNERRIDNAACVVEDHEIIRWAPQLVLHGEIEAYQLALEPTYDKGVRPFTSLLSFGRIGRISG